MEFRTLYDRMMRRHSRKRTMPIDEFTKEMAQDPTFTEKLKVLSSPRILSPDTTYQDVFRFGIDETASLCLVKISLSGLVPDDPCAESPIPLTIELPPVDKIWPVDEFTLPQPDEILFLSTTEHIALPYDPLISLLLDPPLEPSESPKLLDLRLTGGGERMGGTLHAALCGKRSEFFEEETYKLHSVALDLDVSEVRDLSYLLNGQEELVAVDLRHLRAAHARDLTGWMANTAVQTVDFQGMAPMREVKILDDAWLNCNRLTTLLFSTPDPNGPQDGLCPAQLQSMRKAFAFTNLTALSLSGWGCRYLECGMSESFVEAAPIRAVDVTGVDLRFAGIRRSFEERDGRTYLLLPLEEPMLCDPPYDPAPFDVSFQPEAALMQQDQAWPPPAEPQDARYLQAYYDYRQESGDHPDIEAVVSRQGHVYVTAIWVNELLECNGDTAVLRFPEWVYGILPSKVRPDDPWLQSAIQQCLESGEIVLPGDGFDEDDPRVCCLHPDESTGVIRFRCDCPVRHLIIDCEGRELHGSLDNFLRGSPFVSVRFLHANNTAFTGMASCFTNSIRLKQVSFGNLHMGKIASLESAFSGCVQLDSLDLNHRRMPALRTIASLCASCASLQTADLSAMDLSALQDASYAFSGCTSLRSVTFKGTALRSLQDISGAFRDDAQLCDLSLDAFRIAPLRHADEAFLNNRQLLFADLSQWNVRELETAERMLEGSGVGFVSIQDWQAPKLINLSAFVRGCQRLQYVQADGLCAPCLVLINDLYCNSSVRIISMRDWQAPFLSQASGAFALCQNLQTLLTTPGWLSDPTTMQGMLAHCVCLRQFDLRGTRLSRCYDLRDLFLGTNPDAELLCDDPELENQKRYDTTREKTM